MATRPTRPAYTFTADFAESSAYRVAYSYEDRGYVVVETATGKAVFGPGCYQPAYETCARYNYDAAEAEAEARRADEAAVEALEARAAEVDGEIALAEARGNLTITIETATELTPAQQAEYVELTARFYARAEAGAPTEELRALHERAEAIRWGKATCNVCGSDGGPCVEYNPVPAGAATALRRADIFDALCQSADELRDYWRDVSKRLEMINVVWEEMILAEVFYFDTYGNLLVESGTQPGKWYAVGHTCPCDAGRWGGYCRHSVRADIIGRARRIARMQKAA